MEALLLITGSGRITVHLYRGVVHNLWKSIKWVRKVWIRKNKQTSKQKWAIHYQGEALQDCRMRRLSVVIPQVKVEIGAESWLSAIIQSLEPNSQRFVMRINSVHRGLVSIDSFNCQYKREAPCRTAWIPVCLSILKARLCQDVVIRCVSLLPSCQLILQNSSSPFSNESFYCYHFQEKSEMTCRRCRHVCLNVWRAFWYIWRVLPCFNGVLILVPSDSRLLPVFLIILATHLSPVLYF